MFFIIAGVNIIISCSFAPTASNPSPQIAVRVLSHPSAGPRRQTSRDSRDRESSRHHRLGPFILVDGETPRSSSRKTATDGTRELKRTELPSHRRRHTHSCILHRTNHSRPSYHFPPVIIRHRAPRSLAPDRLVPGNEKLRSSRVLSLARAVPYLLSHPPALEP